MKFIKNANKAACASLILAVGAYIAYFVVRILAVSLFRSADFLTIFPLMVIPPLLAVCAVALGHLVRRRRNDDLSPSSSGVSLAGLILGYIFLAYSLFAIGFAIWFSHAMKDFD
jgi:cytochrome bd-type quinol oxidase subunit 2